MIKYKNGRSETKNIAYIDGQNLHLGTTLSDNPWRISLFRFKIYLEKNIMSMRLIIFLVMFKT